VCSRRHFTSNAPRNVLYSAVYFPLGNSESQMPEHNSALLNQAPLNAKYIKFRAVIIFTRWFAT
jgi:hypothetical protein